MRACTIHDSFHGRPHTVCKWVQAQERRQQKSEEFNMKWDAAAKGMSARLADEPEARAQQQRVCIHLQCCTEANVRGGAISFCPSPSEVLSDCNGFHVAFSATKMCAVFSYSIVMHFIVVDRMRVEFNE